MGPISVLPGRSSPLGNPDADFRDGQWESINGLLNRERMLVVQWTGWGKSMHSEMHTCHPTFMDKYGCFFGYFEIIKYEICELYQA